MRKTFLSLASAVAVAVTLSSCSITMPVAVSSNPIGGKVGQATAPVYLGVLTFGGDASIQAAAKNGNITRVATVDMKMVNILGLFQTYTTIVTGE